jgi:Putative MetA-pathway of phenol degradation
LVLRDNGFNMGDLTFGPFYQAKPVMVGGRQVLSWRAEIDFIAPTGGFDPTRDINQSSGFWSINPYISVTVLPLPKWEISARFNYIYNFSTSRGADPPVIPGFTFRNGQLQAASALANSGRSSRFPLSTSTNSPSNCQLPPFRKSATALR